MNELARIDNISELMTIGKAMSASGYFTDARDANQAIVKILAGREMGFGPFAAMSDIHIIQGKPVIGANLMAAAVKSHPKYDYKVVTIHDEAVLIHFFEDGKLIGESGFSMNEIRMLSGAYLLTQNFAFESSSFIFSSSLLFSFSLMCPVCSSTESNFPKSFS